MSRIISGLAGSIKLKAAAKPTRPTSDRVKESLFAKLEHLGVLEGAKVLDLYAGSGALGLEAASRGASEVIMVEKDKAACGVIRDNIRIVSKAIRGACLLTLQPKEVSRFLMTLAGTYSLVFIDPPYELDSRQVDQVIEALTDRLGEGAIIALERSSRSSQPSVPIGFEQIDSSFYGDTQISLIRRVL